jgi:hypothetical protein
MSLARGGRRHGGAPGIRAPADARARGRARRSVKRLVAILALYALALQGILGGAALAAAGPAHVFCLAGHGPDAAAPSGDEAPAHGHMTCCVACHAAGLAAPPPPQAATGAVARPAAASGRRPRGVALPRAPPRHCLGARAPPVA